MPTSFLSMQTSFMRITSFCHPPLKRPLCPKNPLHAQASHSTVSKVHSPPHKQQPNHKCPGSMDKVIPELHTHNVFLADDYQDSFDDIFKRQLIPKEPSFYVNVPSRVDPTAAPATKDSVVVLVPCGHLLQGGADRGLNPQNAQDWQAMVSKARKAVFDTVRLRTGADLQAHITNEIINTPASWKERFNLDKGAILGLSHSFFNVLSFRPSTKHNDIKSLYFVGASTHPGTGVPIVLAGSKITTGQILDDLGMVKPWSPGAHTRKIVSALDEQGRVPLDLMRTIAISLVLLLLMLYLYTSR